MIKGIFTIILNKESFFIIIKYRFRHPQSLRFVFLAGFGLRQPFGDRR